MTTLTPSLDLDEEVWANRAGGGSCDSESANLGQLLIPQSLSQKQGQFKHPGSQIGYEVR